MIDWAGPFPIIKKFGASAYLIKLPGQHRLVFNQDLLLPFPVYPQQRSPPPPDPTLIDDNEEWEVNFIKDSRWTNRLRCSVQYMVNWKGLPVFSDSARTISSARSSRASAILNSASCRVEGVASRHPSNALAAARSDPRGP